jgi:hypothetical protein
MWVALDQVAQDQDMTVTDILASNKRPCTGLMASLPKKLGTGDIINVLPQCDPVWIVVSTDRGGTGLLMG